MRALNLHLPHLRLPHLRLPQMWRPHPLAGGRHMHLPVMGNIWALLLAAVLAVAMLAGLWMSITTPFRPAVFVPF